MAHLIKQKQIAYISDHQFPLNRSDAEAEQVINTVSALAAEGLNIELIIPKRWKNIGLAPPERKRHILSYYEVPNGFRLKELLHLPLMPLRLEKYSHALFAAPYVRRKMHDVIYARNRAHALLALRRGLPVIFETYRVYDQADPRTSAGIARIVRSRNLLGMIAHSLPSRDSLLRAGADAAKVAVIHNGFNPAHIRPRLGKSEARRELGWDQEARIACYAGRLDRMKGIDTVLRLAEATPDVHFFLIGKTVKDSNEWIRKTVRRRGLRNVRELPWVPVKEMSKFLFASDVLVIPPTAKPMMQSGRTVMPIKTFLYMATGVPILAPRLADTEGVLHDKNAALVEPDNLDSAQRILRRIFDDKTWAKSLGERSKSDSRNYTWRRRAGKIVAFLEERLEPGLAEEVPLLIAPQLNVSQN